MKPHFFIIALFFALAAGPAYADANYVFEKAHTLIQFAVSNFDIFTATGEFTQYDGTFIFCRAHPEKDKISITLYAAGIETGDSEQDEEISGPDFFDAAHFPRIDFTSTRIKFINADTAEITGRLTLHGITKPVTFHAHFLGKPEADDGSDDYMVNFAASAIIERSDFGMDYLSPFVIGNDVHIDIQARGISDAAGEDGRKIQ